MVGALSRLPGCCGRHAVGQCSAHQKGRDWFMPNIRDAWVQQAVRKIEADFNRSADTHLIPLRLPAYAGIDLYLKDESSHPTGSLKHRLARSLFLYALCNG